MDILARSPLYSVGLNYRHGTGHGIGAYGLVHESPIQVGPVYFFRFNKPFLMQVRIFKEEEHELKVGMFFSDEPGVYIEDMFGVRLYIKHDFPFQRNQFFKRRIEFIIEEIMN